VVRPTFKALIAALACVLCSCTHPSMTTPAISGRFLTDKTEQEAIALAIIKYDKHNSTFLALNHPNAVYVSIGSSDPSLQFLHASLALPWQVRPWSEHREGGWGASIYGFEMQSREAVLVRLFATCGKNCGSTETYTVEETRGSWRVISMSTDLVL
jgi:hypothetical protein